MKKSAKKFLAVIVFAAALGFVVPANAQKSKAAPLPPRTVTEFYLRLPAKYLPILSSIPNRQSLIKIEDTANGYLRLESNQWEGWGEAALFRRKNGTYILAMTQYECSPVCDGQMTFLDYKNGQWQELDALPRYTVGDLQTAFHGATGRQPSEDEFSEQVFELPRRGKEITLKIGGVPVMGFLWDGEDFVSGMLYLLKDDVGKN